MPIDPSSQPRVFPQQVLGIRVSARFARRRLESPRRLDRVNVSGGSQGHGNGRCEVGGWVSGTKGEQRLGQAKQRIAQVQSTRR